jgi:signal peptidase I
MKVALRLAILAPSSLLVGFLLGSLFWILAAVVLAAVARAFFVPGSSFRPLLRRFADWLFS